MEQLSIALLLLSFTAFVLASIRVTRKSDHREPPYIHHPVPLIGHIVGLIRYGAKYYEIVNKKRQHGIFTLPMLTSRNYVVCDPVLAGQIQRNKTTLSFYSIIVEVTRRLIAFDAQATKITFHNMNGELGPGGLMERVHEMMNEHLGPGPDLNLMTETQARGMGDMLNSEIPAAPDGIVVNLYAWQRHIFSVCNLRAVYGPENVFATDSHLEEEFWAFEDGMLGLVVDIVPQLTARRAYFARRRVLNGLVKFVKTGSWKKASQLIQKRVQTNLSEGISEEMSGHAELILMFGILGNAVPSNFWLMANIFSRPDLLKRIRNELETALDLSPPSSKGTEKNTIRLSGKAIVKGCPLLYSCYRETLRDISLLTSPRMVLEDTLVADKYLLRKNSVVQIAGGLLGHDPRIWGPDVETFNAERFLVAGDDDTTKLGQPIPKGVPSAAFRAFGGGTVICPGRHFAQSELMTFAAILALGFEIEDPDGGCLKLPEKHDMRIPLSVMKPKHDPTVRIRRRDGWETVDWEVGL